MGPEILFVYFVMLGFLDQYSDGWVGRPGFGSLQGQTFLAMASRSSVRLTQPPVQRVPGGGGGGFQVKNAWNYVSIPPYISMA